MTRLMEMMGLGFMPRIVFCFGGPGENAGVDPGDDPGIAAATAAANAANTAAAPAPDAPTSAESASKSGFGSTSRGEFGGTISFSGSAPDVSREGGSARGRAIAGAQTNNASSNNKSTIGAFSGIKSSKEPTEEVNKTTNTAIAKGTVHASRLDDKWGYIDPKTGKAVSAKKDMANGGGKNTAGAGFAFSGGVQADKNNDGFVTAEEAEDVGGLQGNFFSGISNSIGATPLGSGLAPTGIAKGLSYSIPGMIYGGLRNLSRGETRKSIAARTGYTAPGPGYTVQGQSEVSGSSDPSLVDEGMPTDGIVRENIYSTRPTSETYTRRYKGGGMGAYSPSYLRQYASGRKINELVREVTLADGSKAYLTPDGKYLEMDQFDNTATGSQTEIDTGTERYVSGYRMTDSDGNVTEYDAAGNIVYPSLYPELEGVDFKVPNVGDQIPGYSEPELNYDPDQLTPLPNPYPELFEPGGPYSEPFLNYDPDQLVPLPNPYPELFDPDYVRSPPRAGFDPNNPGSGI